MELICFLDPIPQHHQLDLPINTMDAENTGFKFPHLRPEGNMPLSMTSEGILGASIEITKLDEEEDLAEITFI
jgi:hypothetical protein